MDKESDSVASAQDLAASPTKGQPAVRECKLVRQASTVRCASRRSRPKTPHGSKERHERSARPPTWVAPLVKLMFAANIGLLMAKTSCSS